MGWILFIDVLLKCIAVERLGSDIKVGKITPQSLGNINRSSKQFSQNWKIGWFFSWMKNRPSSSATPGPKWHCTETPSQAWFFWIWHHVKCYWEDPVCPAQFSPRSSSPSYVGVSLPKNLRFYLHFVVFNLRMECSGTELGANSKIRFFFIFIFYLFFCPCSACAVALFAC